MFKISLGKDKLWVEVIKCLMVFDDSEDIK